MEPPLTASSESPAEELVRLMLARKGIRLPGSRPSGVAPRPSGAPARLSYPQQRLWFLHQLDPRSVAYNLSAAFDLAGPLDERALEQSLQTIVARHDALRTTFRLSGGEGVFEVAPEIAVELVREDLQSLPAPGRDAALDDRIARLAAEPFELAHGPLLRAALLQLAPHDHVLVLVVHHIVFDGGSIDVFVRELRVAYAAFAAGRTPALPVLPVQYQDFAHWQRSCGDADAYRAERVFWAERLAKLTPLDLPTDRRRPAKATLRGASHVFSLPVALTASVRELARSYGATPFMVLLAGFFVLLHRYTGRDDLAVGSPIANRREPDLEGVIGLFSNTLVLRADLSGRPTFVESLARVRRLALEAYEHQDVPFEHLVEELQPDRDAGRQPLFQVAFALQHAGIDRLELAGLTLTPRLIPSSASKFDLTLALTDGPEAIAGSVEYATDLFDAATISRMMQHYVALLQNAVSEPGRAIAELDWVLEPLVVSGGPISAARQRFEVSERLDERFARQAAATPNRVAVSAEDAQLTYAELDARANRLASFLRRTLGAGPETRVGLFFERSADLIVAILGVLKTGAAYVPVDPASPADRVAFITEDAGVIAVLTQTRVAARLPVLAVPVRVLDEDAALAAEPPIASATAGPTTTAAYVIYTSGSTGRPKGVIVQHDHVQRLFDATAGWFAFGPDDVWTLFHSYGFDFSVWEIWGALLHGGRLVVVPYLVSRSPEAFHALLARERVTVLNQTPSAFVQLVAADARAVGVPLALRWVIFGGEALDLETLRPWFARRGDARPRLVNMYGITETTVHVTFRPITSADLERGVGSVIGEAIPDLVVYLCDADMRLVPPGVPGEIYVGGAGVARGYLGRPGLTADRFVPDAFSGEPGARLYRSGDRARWRSDGDLEYLGRLDDQVKIRGFRIELGEIESSLAACEGVMAAVVVARREADADPRLVAYVVLREQGAPTRADLRRWLQQRLPDYMVPAMIVPIPVLPLTAHGKVDRRALPEPDQERPADQAFVAAATAEERVLVDVWREVLSLDRIGVSDNFFTLGGDSIRAIKLVSRAREQGVEVGLADLFEHQTVRALAARARVATVATAAPARAPFALTSAADRSRLPADVEDAYPLTLLQRGMLFHGQFAPNAHAYHNVSSFHLRMAFEPDALERVVDEMVARHPILRTSFNLTDFDTPLQLVHRTIARPLVVDDLRHLGGPAQETWLSDWFREEQNRHFDGARAPLLRLHVHRRAEDRLQLTLTEHHAILDGWSVASLLTELMTGYLAAIGEAPRPSPLPLSATFADYVAQEEAMRQSEAARAFWSGRIADVFAPFQISSSQSDVQGSVAGPVLGPIIHRLVVPAELVAPLHDVARRCGVPLKSALLAAHMKIVGSMSAAADAVSGLVVNARPESRDGERVLGLFLNTVPFRVLTTAPSWLELVSRTFAAERDLLPFRGFPLADLQRGQSVRPLFDVVFNFVHFHVYEALGRLPGVALIGEQSYAHTNFPLGASFSFDATDGRLVLNLEAAPGVTSPDTLRDLGERYVTVLAAMTANPERSPDDVSVLLDRERVEILRRNRVREAVAPPVHARIARHASSSPAAPAVVSAGTTWTYGQLHQRAGEIAAALVDAGVHRGDLVAVSADASPSFIAALLGVMRAGAAFVPIDPSYPADRVRAILADATPAALITDGERAVPVEFGGHVLSIGLEQCPPVRSVRLQADRRGPAETGRYIQLENAVAEASDAVDPESERPGISVSSSDLRAPIPDLDPEDLAYVIYTSGSTGIPKGVTIRHGGLANLCDAQIRRFELDSSSRTLLFASIGFDAAVSEIFTTLVAGGTLYVAPRHRLRSPDALRDEIHERGITVVTLPPTMLAAMDPVPERALRTVVSAGEPCTAEIVRRWAPGRRLLNAYGPTETTVCATMTGPLVDVRDPVPIGEAIEGAEAFVLDKAMQPVPVGVSGELLVGGIALARGYLNRPDLTAERFVPHPFSTTPGARLYRTGDLARWVPGGYLQYLGRADHQVKVRGVRIELDEVAAVLGAHPDVRQAVAVVRQRDEGSPMLVAYVVAREGRAPSVESLRSLAAARLPDQAVPSSFVVVETMPLTTSGKIDRRALPDPGETRPALDVAYVAPRTDVEARLAAVWARVLGLSRVGVDDNFFSLGGDSIVSLQVVAHAQAAGIRVTPEDIFRYSTIAALSTVARVAERRVRGTRPAGGVPLTPIQQWFFEQRLAVPAHWNQSLLLAMRVPAGDRVSPSAAHGRLQSALDAVLAAHDALRLRFREEASGWAQWYDEDAASVPLETIDLSALNDTERSAALIEHGERIQRGLDLTGGPLFRAASVHLGDADGDRLLLVGHHLIVDGVSWRIVIEDLMQALGTIAAGDAASIEPEATSFQEWSTALASHVGTEDIRGQRAHWAQPSWGDVPRLPVDVRAEGGAANLEATAATVDVFLDEPDTSSLLREVPAMYGAQISDVLLTALVDACETWTGERRLLVDLEGHGRERVDETHDVSRTVGWFTSLYPVLLDARGATTPGDALRRIKEQIRAVPRKGFGYGLLRYFGDPATRTELASHGTPDISFNYLGQIDAAVSPHALFGAADEAHGALRAPENRRAHLIDVAAAVIGGRLRMTWTFDAQQLRRETIERVVNACVGALLDVVAHCRDPRAGGYTPSDFPEMDVSAEELDEIVRDLDARLEGSR
ncbi:MAG: amino acid adenylation domain-containing protein [Acidobacteriota bacterium]